MTRQNKWYDTYLNNSNKNNCISRLNNAGTLHLLSNGLFRCTVLKYLLNQVHGKEIEMNKSATQKYRTEKQAPDGGWGHAVALGAALPLVKKIN